MAESPIYTPSGLICLDRKIIQGFFDELRMVSTFFPPAEQANHFRAIGEINVAEDLNFGAFMVVADSQDTFLAQFMQGCIYMREVMSRTYKKFGEKLPKIADSVGETFDSRDVLLRDIGRRLKEGSKFSAEDFDILGLSRLYSEDFNLKLYMDSFRSYLEIFKYQSSGGEEAFACTGSSLTYEMYRKRTEQLGLEKAIGEKID